MKVLCIVIGWISFFQPLYAQSERHPLSRPVIDTTTVNSWVRVATDYSPLISPEGDYISYRTTTNHYDRSKRVNQLILQAITKDWQQVYLLTGSNKACFSNNGYFLFQHKDSLRIVNLVHRRIRLLTKIASFEHKASSSTDWACWISTDQTLTLLDLVNKKELQIRNVQDFSFNTDGTAMVLQQQEPKGAKTIQQLTWVDLSDLSKKMIWHDSSSILASSAFDLSGKQFVFQTNEVKPHDKAETSIWYYQSGNSAALLKVQNNSTGIDSGLIISNYPPCFNRDGSTIVFALTKLPALRERIPGAASVDVWSYTDKVFQSAQAKSYPENFLASVSSKGDRVIRLQFENEKMVYPSVGQVPGSYIIVLQDTIQDRFWRRRTTELFRNYLVSIKDGSRVPLHNGSEYSTLFWVSPDSRFVLYYLLSTKQYYSYEIETKRVKLLSGDVAAGSLSVLNEFEMPILSKDIPIGIAGWPENTSTVWVYDNYDLWQLDLEANHPAINLTNGLGTRTRTKFRLFRDSEIATADGKLYLTGYNVDTKHNGFFCLQKDRRGDPEKCFMGPFVFNLRGKYILPQNASLFNWGTIPVKATNVDKWLVCRQSYNEAPNYYLTTDFKDFNPLTDYRPQTAVNWLSASLISFSQMDGTRSQGVLYKPENFDSTQKYPLIITYYQQSSQRLYDFPDAAYSADNINIPWFVSRGYLVFTPDIYFKIGTASGPHALNAVEGAARYLSTFKYLDKYRIGIMGHSMAGAMTHYIVTHSNRFAAALAGAGVSNSISSALQLNPQNGKSRLQTSETYFLGGKSMWDRPDLYLTSMSIMNAHKVTTPLLMLHCLNDGAVPWQQSLDMFTALWRLEKPVWLLQYDEGDHGVDGFDALDYTFRITQFFDHYLKKKPAPLWMQKGVPHKDKQFVKGY